MKKHIFALFIFLLSGAAFAQKKQGYIASLPAWRTTDQCMSLDAVCKDIEAKHKPASCPSSWENCQYHVSYCSAEKGYSAYVSGTVRGEKVGGPSSSFTTGIVTCKLEEEKNDTEKENKCTAIAGKVTKLSVPAGWAHLDSTGEVRDFKPSGPAPDQVCKGGCQYLLMSNEVVPGSTVYAPKINNGGYHPVFTQYTYAGTDTQCEADTDLTTPSTPPPPPEKPKEPEKPFTCPTGKCPGVANGQQVCVPCGSTPGQGEGDGDDKGKDKEPGDSSGNNNGSDKGDKDGSKDGSSDGTPGGTGNSSGGINGTGSGNGNGTGNGKGNGTGNGKGSSGGGGGGGGTMKGEKDGEKEDNTPPAFGERPGLYEPKYKNGVKGVWDQKKGQLQNSGLGRLSKRLMPTVNSGTCPRWDIDLNFGRNMNFGTKNVAPPCTIWPILRAMVMVCSLILARKLVFGG